MSIATLRLFERRIHIVNRLADCDWCPNRAAHTELPFLSRAELARGAHRDELALADLRRVIGERVPGSIAHVKNADVVARVAGLIANGRLRAIACRAREFTPAAVGPLVVEPLAGPALRPPKTTKIETKTWVGIELLYDTGEPVAGERYSVVLPDGKTRSGTLDANGQARITDIDPGTCRISFPDIDGREWKSA